MITSTSVIHHVSGPAVGRWATSTPLAQGGLGGRRDTSPDTKRQNEQPQGQSTAEQVSQQTEEPQSQVEETESSVVK